MQPDTPYDTTAALLTAVMLRFDIDRLRPNTVAIPTVEPERLGEVAFVFLPRQELVADRELVHYLQGLPKPVILGALAQKGMVATWWPAGLDERARAVWDHALANQQRSVAQALADHRLADSDPVLLETPAETLVFPAGALRRWGDTYGVHIGWTLSDLTEDPRARARLNLVRGDGGRTPDQSCARPS